MRYKQQKKRQEVQARSTRGISIRLEEVTPKKAAAYLTKKKQGKNDTLTQRPLKRPLWQTYKQAMKDKHWMLTHQCIAFDKNGDLIDGQHRLQAIVESGETIKMFVVRGLDPQVFQFIDSYQPRKATNLLCNLRPVMTDGTSSMTAGVARRVTNIARFMLMEGKDSGSFTQLVLAEYANLHFELLRDVDNNLGPLDLRPGPLAVSAAFTNGALSSGLSKDVLDLADVWRHEEWRSPASSDPLKAGKRKVRELITSKGADGRSLPNGMIYSYTAGALNCALSGHTRKIAVQLEESFHYSPEEQAVRKRAANNISIQKLAEEQDKPPRTAPLKRGVLNMRSSTPVMNMMKITPMIAKRILAECIPKATDTSEVAFGQGLLFQGVVNYIAGRMLSKPGWMLIHQGGIAFDWYGNLIDGKHTLHAIVQSQTTQTLFVTKGLDPKVFKVIDNGRRRSAGDFLICIRGKDANLTAGMASRVCKIARCMLAGPGLKGKGGKFRDHEVALYANRHYGLIYLMEALLGTIVRHRAAGITAAFCNAAIVLNDVEKVRAWASRFHSGVFSAGDPLGAAHARIKKLWDDAETGNLPDGKKTIQPDMFYRFMLSALKAAIANEKLKTCDESREDFEFVGTEKESRKCG